MSDPLATYLIDHLAGSKGAIGLLHFLRDQHAGEPIGRMAAEILEDVEQDRQVLQDLLNRTGSERTAALKEGIAWVGEKLVRFKLNRRAGGGLGTFQALESLGLGIRGKLALWRALNVAAAEDHRLRGPDFERLADRAHAQFDNVEAHRLGIARTLFRSRAA